MSRSLIRLGLWALLLVVAVALLREIFDSPLHSLSSQTMQKAFIGAGAVVALGVVLLVLENLFGTPKGRCVVCRVRVPPGEIYCKSHLREILDEEDKREHTTALRD